MRAQVDLVADTDREVRENRTGLDAFIPLNERAAPHPDSTWAQAAVGTVSAVDP